MVEKAVSRSLERRIGYSPWGGASNNILFAFKRFFFILNFLAPSGAHFIFTILLQYYNMFAGLHDLAAAAVVLSCCCCAVSACAAKLLRPCLLHFADEALPKLQLPDHCCLRCLVAAAGAATAAAAIAAALLALVAGLSCCCPMGCRRTIVCD